MEENTETQNNIGITLEQKIEAILFYKGGPVKITELSKIFSVGEPEIDMCLTELEINLQSRGIRLSRKEDSVALVTSIEAAEIIDQIKKDELSRDLSKAALETLSIIIYRGPIKRSEIDYIRGVNSQFILRLLLIRGLIEKVTNPKDERGYLYKPSFDLLNILGLNKINDVPDFENVNTEIDQFISDKEGAEEVDE